MNEEPDRMQPDAILSRLVFDDSVDAVQWAWDLQPIEIRRVEIRRVEIPEGWIPVSVYMEELAHGEVTDFTLADDLAVEYSEDDAATAGEILRDTLELTLHAGVHVEALREYLFGEVEPIREYGWLEYDWSVAADGEISPVRRRPRRDSFVSLDAMDSTDARLDEIDDLLAEVQEMLER